MAIFGIYVKIYTGAVCFSSKPSRLHLLLAFSRLDALQQLFMLVYAQARFADLGKMLEMCKETPGMCAFFGGRIPKASGMILCFEKSGFG